MGCPHQRRRIVSAGRPSPPAGGLNLRSAARGGPGHGFAGADLRKSMRVDGNGVCLVAWILAGQRFGPYIEASTCLDHASPEGLVGLRTQQTVAPLPAEMATKT